MERRNFMNVIDKFKDIQMKEIWCENLIVLSQCKLIKIEHLNIIKARLH